MIHHYFSRRLCRFRRFHKHLLNLLNLREIKKQAVFNFIRDKIFAPKTVYF